MGPARVIHVATMGPARVKHVAVMGPARVIPSTSINANSTDGEPSSKRLAKHCHLGEQPVPFKPKL